MFIPTWEPELNHKYLHLCSICSSLNHPFFVRGPTWTALTIIPIGELPCGQSKQLFQEHACHVCNRIGCLFNTRYILYRLKRRIDVTRHRTI